MKLSYEQVQSVALGAVRVTEEDDGIHFYRFTAAQEALYSRTGTGVTAYDRSIATAGVRLRFKTNSTVLGLTVSVTQRTSRSYFSVDVLVNGKTVGYLDNIGDTVLQGNPAQEMPLGRFEGSFALGEGEKEVCVHFPWSVRAVLECITLDDGASLVPVKPQKKILVLGDSITQGYDALRPSHRYAAVVCDRLNGEEVNKAIGGEKFFPPLAATPDGFTPDLIWVAYGTNDWACHTEEEFLSNCRGFFDALRAAYPKVPIVAVTPIWRAGHDREVAFGSFDNVARDIRLQTAHIPDLYVVDGYDFVPHEAEYFADLILHPNDQGFVPFADKMTEAIAALKLWD